MRGRTQDLTSLGVVGGLEVPVMGPSQNRRLPGPGECIDSPEQRFLVDPALLDAL
jgi:hypothetical protein